MKSDPWRLALISVTAVLTAAGGAAAQGAGDPFTVTGPATVLTADTISVQDHIMQLYGIDAPRQAQPCVLGGEQWACGVAATRQLQTIVDLGPATCTEFKDTYFTRRAFVWGKCEVNGTDVSAEMVRNGWAVALSEQTDEYVALEEAAQEAKLGLWKADVFERPADWEFHSRTE